MTRHLLTAIISLSIGCGGSDKKVVDPTPADTGGDDSGPASPAPVLNIGPFALTVTGTAQDGAKKVRVFRGSADGVLSVEENGETREVARVAADGTFTPLEPGRKEMARLSADGSLVVNGKPLPGRVGDDGTVYRGEEPLLKIEGGQVIILLEDLKSSKVTANGKVISETTWEMSVEGGDEVRRLVGAVLLLQLAGGSVKTSAPSAPPATPAPPPDAP